MADFEFYTKNVPLEPAPVAQVPRETVVSELGKALSSVGESILGKQIRVQKEVGLEKASEAGSMAGEKLGFVPKEAKTEQDIVFNKAALQAQKMSIQMDVRNRTLAIQQDVLSHSSLNSINEYNARIKSYAQNLLPTISPALQPYTKNQLEYHGLTNKTQIVSEVDSLHRNMLNSNIQLSVNNNLDEASKASFAGNRDSAKATQVDVKRTLDSALATGTITSSYHTQALLAMDKTIKNARYIGKFSRDLAENKANESIANFTKTNQKDLTWKEKQQLLTTFTGMITKHKQMILAQYGNIDTKVKDLAASIMLNGLNPATVNQMAKLKSIVNDYYPDNIEKARETNEVLDFSVERHNFTAAHRYDTPADLQTALLEKQEELKKGPVAQKFQKTQEFAQLSKDAEKIIKERKSDLYNIVSQNPAVMAATNAQRNANQANVSMTTGVKLGSATVNSIQDRDEIMIQTEKGMGTHPSDYEIISPDKIQAFGQIVAEGDPEKSINALQTILAQHQDHRGVAFNQIQKAIKGPLTMFFNGAMNPETAPRRDYMFIAAREQTKDLEAAMTKGDNITGIKDDVNEAIMKDYGAALLNKTGDPTSILKNSSDYAYKLALVYQRNGIHPAAQTAVRDALDAHVQKATYNGKRFLIPKSNNYSTTDIKIATSAMLETIDPKKLHVPLNFRPNEKYDVRQKAYKTFLIADGYPAMNSTNTGIVLLNDARQPINIIEGDSRNARLTKELGFDFDDLHVNTSEVSKAIQKSKIKDRFSNIVTAGFASRAGLP